MINKIKNIIKTLGIETSKSTQTKIKGLRNAGKTKGINIKQDKFSNDVLIHFYKLDNKTIEKITKVLNENGYKTDIVPGIIIVTY